MKWLLLVQSLWWTTTWSFTIAPGGAGVRARNIPWPLLLSAGTFEGEVIEQVHSVQQSILDVLKDKSPSLATQFKPQLLHDARSPFSLKTVTMILNTVASEEQDPTIADDIVALLRHQSSPDLQPNCFVYGAYLKVWTRDPERVEAIFLEMKDPTAFHYESVIFSWSNADARVYKQAATRALSMYRLQQQAWLQLSRRCYLNTLKALSYSKQPGMAQESLKVLSDMRDEAHSNQSLKPDTWICNLVLRSLANSPQDVAQEAYNLLHEMWTLAGDGDHTVIPDDFTYGNVFRCSSKSYKPEAPRQVLELLQDMWKRYTNGHRQLQPTLVIYNLVLNTLTKSSNQAMKRNVVLQLLNDMWSRSETIPALKPNRRTYNAVIHAVGDGPTALRLLQEMKDQDSRDFAPDTVSYNSCLNALASDSSEEAAELATQLLLQEMRHDTAMPDVVSYSTVINAWALSGSPSAGTRASQLLSHAWEQYYRADSVCRPNTILYTSVMNAWSKMDIGGGKVASALLSELWERHQELGFDDLMPNVQTYTTVMDAHARTGAGAVKAHELLQELWSRYNSGFRYLKPNIISYSAVVNAYAKSGRDRKAYELLQELWHRYDVHGDLKPSRVVYNACIDACAKSHDAKSKSMALQLLQDMKDKCAQGEGDLCPDEVTFTSAIQAQESGEIIADLIAEMWDAHNTRGIEPPNLSCYAAALESYAKSTDQDAGRQASQLLQEIWKKHSNEGYKDLKPGVALYIAVMRAWSNSQHPEAKERIAKLVAEIKQRYKHGDRDFEPSDRVKQALLAAIQNIRE